MPKYSLSTERRAAANNIRSPRRQPQAPSVSLKTVPAAPPNTPRSKKPKRPKTRRTGNPGKMKTRPRRQQTRQQTQIRPGTRKRDVDRRYKIGATKSQRTRSLFNPGNDWSFASKQSAGGKRR